MGDNIVNCQVEYEETLQFSWKLTQRQGNRAPKSDFFKSSEAHTELHAGKTL